MAKRKVSHGLAKASVIFKMFLRSPQIVDENFDQLNVGSPGDSQIIRRCGGKKRYPRLVNIQKTLENHTF